MRGHETLIAMRQRRRMPSRGVLIEVSDVLPWNVGLRGETPESAPDTALLWIRPDEQLDRLDLRCVVGLKVLVYALPGVSQERAVRAVCMACVTGGAGRVYGVQAMTDTPMEQLPQSHIFFDYTKEP